MAEQHAFAQPFDRPGGMIRVGPVARKLYDPFVKAVGYVWLDPDTVELVGAWERFERDERAAIYGCLRGMGATNRAIRRLRDGVPCLQVKPLQAPRTKDQGPGTND
jgi:hypothetical protein